MEKQFLSGNLKLDEVSLRKIFIYNLNQIYPILVYLTENLPILAKATYYGDLENAIDELSSEVNVQIFRIADIFNQLKEVPAINNNFDNNKALQILNPVYKKQQLDGLSEDLLLVFYLQRIVAIKGNYFYVLKSISNSLNNINIKQYLQCSCDECDENKTVFRLIAKEYMDSSINNFLK